MTYISNLARYEGDPRVLHSGPSSMNGVDRLARLLGWFSIGLGMLELVAPGRIARALGMDGSEQTMRAYGAREIGSGILSLSLDKEAGLWSRVVGDGLDIATLLPALHPDNPKRGNVGLAIAAVAGVMALDYIAAQGVRERHREGTGMRRTYRDRSGFPQGVQSARGAAAQRGHQ